MNFKFLNAFLLIIALWVNATSASMPPMPPPSMMKDINSPKAKTSAHQDKLSTISECSALPPMIIFLPPPMESSLVGCRNKYFKPSNKDASVKLSKYYKKTIKVTSVSIVDGFREVYKISIKDKKKKYSRYCNKDLNSCLK